MISPPRRISRAEARDAAAKLGSILRLTSLTIIIAALGALAVSAPDQAHEALRIMVEQRRGGTWTDLLTFILATLGASLLAWYSARVLLYLLAPRAHSARGARGWAARNVPRLAGMIPYVGAIRGLNRASKLGAGGSIATELEWWAVVMAALALATYLGFVFRQRILRWLRDLRGRELDVTREALAQRGSDAEAATAQAAAPAVHARSVRDLPGFTRWAARIAPVIWIIVCAVVIGTDGRALLWMGPLGVILISISSWIIIANTLLYLGARMKFPLVRVVLVWWVIINACNLPDNHTLRAADEASGRVSLPRYADAFTEWLGTRADRPRYADAYPVFLVAAEGGGLRNAYITAAVLSYLQDRCPAFAQHTFAITSVSGGSVGASVFTALTAARRAPNAPTTRCSIGTAAPASYVSLADSILGRDLLTPLLAMGLYPDLLQRFIPASFERWDRARGLELALERSWREVVGDAIADSVGLARSFYALPVRDASLSVPALLLNTTHVQTGQRMVVSHVLPDSADFSGMPSLATLSDSLHPPLSSAAFLSARFPFVTPEGTFTARGGVQRYVDGGYFDNSGATTVAEMLTARTIERPPFPIRPVVLLVGFTSRKNVIRREKYTKQGLNEALTPLRTLMNTRDARGDVAVAQLKTLVERMTQRGAPAEIIEIDLAESRIPLPLGWLISDATRHSMRDSLAPANYCASEATRRQQAGLPPRPCGYDRVVELLTPVR